MNKINWLKTLVSNNNNELSNFYGVFEEDSYIKNALTELNDEKSKLLIPLLEDGSNSFFAIWSIHPDRELEQQPIVWIECEANPISVCAKNFDDFLSLLPYGGMLHNLFSKVDFYLMEERPENKYINLSAQELQQIISNCETEFPYMKEFNLKLKDELGIVPTENPFATFLDAFDSEPDFYHWSDN